MKVPVSRRNVTAKGSGEAGNEIKGGKSPGLKVTEEKKGKEVLSRQPTRKNEDLLGRLL